MEQGRSSERGYHSQTQTPKTRIHTFAVRGSMNARTRRKKDKSLRVAYEDAVLQSMQSRAHSRHVTSFAVGHNVLITPISISYAGRGCAPQRSVNRLAIRSSSVRSASSGKGPVVVIDNYDSFTYNLCQVGARVCFFCA